MTDENSESCFSFDTQRSASVSSNGQKEEKNSKRRAILQGVIVHLDGVSTEEHKLRNKLMTLGASISPILNENVTHVVSTDFNSRTCKNALLLKRRPLIVSPLWISECNQQRKYVSEAPYLLYSLKEELEMASEQTSEKHIRNDSRCPKEKNGVNEQIDLISAALNDFRIEPVAVKTKSNALNALQLMPTPPELTNQRTHIRRNIVISVTCETLKNQLRERIRRLGVYEYKRCVNQHTKVLVVDNDTRITSNHLKAILIGVRIVGEEWVYKSWEKGCWLNPTNTYCIPKWYRMYKRCKGRGMKNLFAGSELFFVSTGCSLPYETITFLISYGGGKLTKRICEADVVISGCKHRSNIIKFMSKTKPVQVVVVQWVIDSILKGSRRPFAEYEHELTQHFSTAFVSKLEVYDSEIAYEDDDRNTSSESSFTEFGTPKCDNLKVETISISGTPMKLNENECYVYTPSNVNQSTSNISDL